MSPKSTQADIETGRGHLQRSSIVQTALALMNEIGLDALTLRRLAAELHVQAPALYWHFKNKQELLNEMAEAMLTFGHSTSNESPGPVEWSQTLMSVGHGLHGTLMRYRDGARLLASADVSKAALLSLDAALGVLVGAGFGYRLALLSVGTIVNFTLGFTLEEQTRPRRENGLEYIRELVAATQARHLSAAFASAEFEGDTAIPDSAAEFDASLRLIVEGIKAQH